MKTDSESIVASFPINLWFPSTDIETIELKNNLASVVFELPLIDNLKDVSKVKSAIDKSFNPISVQATNTLAKVLSYFPLSFFHMFFSFLNRNGEILLSNVSGSRTYLRCGDQDILHISAFGPYVPPASMIFICHTYCNETTIHVTSDQNLPFTAKQISNKLNEILDEFIAEHNKSK